jgi:hypothetical protein
MFREVSKHAYQLTQISWQANASIGKEQELISGCELPSALSIPPATQKAGKDV